MLLLLFRFLIKLSKFLWRQRAERGRKGNGETGKGSSWRQKTPHRRIFDRFSA